ncbi:hypothetical protein SUGI_0050470 [Cryptomeria japonica]|nr:hypothetical protein SUGI_0050470 [Cryptomeria japonica]
MLGISDDQELLYSEDGVVKTNVDLSTSSISDSRKLTYSEDGGGILAANVRFVASDCNKDGQREEVGFGEGEGRIQKRKTSKGFVHLKLEEMRVFVTTGNEVGFGEGEALVESAKAAFICTHHNEKHSGSLKEHSMTMYSCYWCVYGPDDHRNDPPTKEHARNFTKKWGCQCHIIVKVMKGRLDVAILVDIGHFCFPRGADTWIFIHLHVHTGHHQKLRHGKTSTVV